MYETALIQSGFDVEDVSNFSKRIHSMIRVGLGADEDVPAAEAIPTLEEAKNTEDVD